MDTNFSKNFKKCYDKLYNLHPNSPELFHLSYVNQNWFFPNHLNLVLKNIKKFHEKYFPKSNLEIALFAGLFHDSGLVYERESASPKGHEERSTEYAEKELKRLGYSEEFINKVKECINATEPQYISELEEAIIVRNADAYSHFISIHFFAKSNFTEEIEDFINWFDKKSDSTFVKLTIPGLKEEIEPIYKSYKKMIEIYNIEKNNSFEELNLT